MCLHNRRKRMCINESLRSADCIERERRNVYVLKNVKSFNSKDHGQRDTQRFWCLYWQLAGNLDTLRLNDIMT